MPLLDFSALFAKPHLPSPLPCGVARVHLTQQMTANQMTPMQEFNELVESADAQTGYRFDNLGLVDLVAVLGTYNLPLALAIKRLAIELGLWRRN